jgi:hypothetical protein
MSGSSGFRSDLSNGPGQSDLRICHPGPCPVPSAGSASTTRAAGCRRTRAGTAAASGTRSYGLRGLLRCRGDRRFRTLAAGKNVKGVVVTAIARELAGFLWAEMIH